LQANAQVPLHKYGVIIEEDILNEYDLKRLIVKTSYDIYFLLFRRPVGGVKEYRISATTLTVDNGWDDLSPEAMEIILQILAKFSQTNWKWGSDSSIIQINLHLVEFMGITSYLKLRDDIIDALDRPEYRHLFSIAKAEDTANRIVDSKEDMLVASTSPLANAQEYAESHTSSQVVSQSSSDSASIHQARDPVISMDCPIIGCNLIDTIIIHDDAVASAKSTYSSKEQSQQDTPANDQRIPFSDLDLIRAEIYKRENNHYHIVNAAISNSCGVCCIM
jgi:hypothetical protein